MKTLALTVAAAVWLCGSADHLTAQGGAVVASAGLTRIEALIAEGDFAAARNELSEWWAENSRDASRDDLQKGYWLRGKVTTDARQASIDFRRLVVEFPGGPYSDMALLRLALLAQAQGEFDSAVGYFQELLRDYPSSPLRSDAENWLNSQGMPLDRQPPDPPEESTDDPAGGDSATADSPSEAAGTEASEPSSDTASPPTAEFPPDANVSIQLGAFQSVERATILRGQIEGAGFRARLVRVPGSDLVRVRVGRWTNDDDANGVLDEVRAAGFEAIRVRDATEETEVTGGG